MGYSITTIQICIDTLHTLTVVPLISQTFQDYQVMWSTTREARINSTFSCEFLNMDKLMLADLSKLAYIRSVQTQDVVKKTYWEQWMIEIIFTNPSARAGYDTRSIFKRSLTGLNSEFSFS